MTRGPDFDELVGDDLEGNERDRLRRVHELLVNAGPPPELSPELEAGPDMLATYRRRPGTARRWRRPGLLAAALLLVAVAFLAGYVSGNNAPQSERTAFAARRLVALKPTSEAPTASASLGLGAKDAGGNWPMRLTVSGLPQPRGNAYYAVFLVEHGKTTGYCGSFVVHEGEATAYLNAPYKLGRDADWIVTLQHPGDRKPGPVFLRT
jgi:hypothetical protein